MKTFDAKENWKVYPLSVESNPVDTLIERLRNEDFLKSEHYGSFASEATLVKMIDTVNAKGFRILIGLNGITNTPEIVAFLSIFESCLLEDKKIYLICTGTAENVETISNTAGISFFRRGDCFEIIDGETR